MSLANPHFKLIDRAPHELANLLGQLPPQSVGAKLSGDELLMLSAAVDHAANYNTAVLGGIEAIGHLLFSAATNEKWPLEQRVVSDVGALLSALAVQAQYLQDFATGADATLARQGGAV